MTSRTSTGPSLIRGGEGPLPPVGARVVILAGVYAHEHAVVVEHDVTVNDRPVCVVRRDGARETNHYPPRLLEETGIVQGDLFAGGA